MEEHKYVKIKSNDNLFLIVFIMIMPFVLFSCYSGHKIDIERNMLITKYCFKRDSEVKDSNIYNSDVNISVSIDGRVIRSEELKACLIKNDQDTLKIIFTNSGLTGNNLLINCYNGYYESYIEFWSDYNEFNGENSLIIPLNNTSLILNNKVFSLGDTLSGIFNCQSILNSDYFDGEVMIESKGCFVSLIKQKWK